MRPNIEKLILSISLLLTLCTINANAAYQLLGESGWAAITDDLYAVNIEVKEVDFDYDQVVIGITKSFENGPDKFGNFQPIVIEFEKATNSEAISTIVIDDELVYNNTGVEWLDYHVFLMVDMFTPEAGFSKLSIPDGGQFESVNYSAYGSGFNNMPIQIDFLNLEGQGVLSSPSKDNVFAPGFIEGDIRIVTNQADMQQGDRFGFKQFPTIPEPATMFFMGLGVSFAVKMNRKNGRA